MLTIPVRVLDTIPQLCFSCVLQTIRDNAAAGPSFLESYAKQSYSAQQKESEMASRRTALERDVGHFRARFSALLRENESAAAIEKLDLRLFFSVDEELRDSLTRDGEARVEAVRARVRDENSGKQLVWRRIRTECWDPMEVKGQVLKGLKAELEVTNFPIRTRSAADQARIKRMTLLRKIGILERKWIRISGKPKLSRAALEADPEAAERQAAAAAARAANGHGDGGDHDDPSRALFDEESYTREANYVLVVDAVVHGDDSRAKTAEGKARAGAGGPNARGKIITPPPSGLAKDRKDALNVTSASVTVSAPPSPGGGDKSGSGETPASPSAAASGTTGGSGGSPPAADGKDKPSAPAAPTVSVSGGGKKDDAIIHEGLCPAPIPSASPACHCCGCISVLHCSRLRWKSSDRVAFSHSFVACCSFSCRACVCACVCACVQRTSICCTTR
jgi:hypothetical protein